MSCCQSCGGVIGRDCFNPSECMAITQDMAQRYQAQGDVQGELASLRHKVGCAIRFLKNLGRFQRLPATEPDPMDCTLAGRVSHVFGIGMTYACQLCREYCEDPEYREPE